MSLVQTTAHNPKLFRVQSYSAQKNINQHILEDGTSKFLVVFHEKQRN